MRHSGIALLAFAVCHVILIDQSDAMFGLCSTNWMSDNMCFDNNDECKELGGQCYHDGVGDHGEGCECKAKVKDGDGFKWKVLEKHHIPLVTGQPMKNAPKQPIKSGPSRNIRQS